MPRPVRFLGIIDLGISQYKFYWAICCVHMQESYCKYPGMKHKNWDAATCQTLAPVSTTLVHIKYSNP